MKKNITIVSLVLVLASFAFGQTATTSTTLSAAVTDTSGRVITVASATNINAPSSTDATKSTVLLVDGELMQVNAVNGTSITVMRGYAGSRASTHASGATVYVGVGGGANIFTLYTKRGSCTASNESYLPQINTNISSPDFGLISDCFGSVWQYDLNLSLYKLTLAPNAQRSGSSPTVGATTSIVAQAGGASTAAATAGANGGPITVGSGAGGAGASTGTGGNGGTATLSAGNGGAAAGSGGVGGNGGSVAITAGTSGGTVTSGNGGSVSITAGNSANGSTAAGNGGNVNIKAGKVGTGGTGTAGFTFIQDPTDATKQFKFDPSGGATASNLTFASAITASRTVTFPDQSVTVIPVMNHSATAVNASTLHIVRDTCTLGTNCNVTFTGAAVFADTNYVCSAQDTTAAAATRANIGSASTVTFTGTGTDVLIYTCIGN